MARRSGSVEAEVDLAGAESSVVAKAICEPVERRRRTDKSNGKDEMRGFFPFGKLRVRMRRFEGADIFVVIADVLYIY